MDYILSHPGLIKRAKLLAQRIKEISGREIVVFSSPTNVIGRCVIRYGNSTPVSNGFVKYNSPEHIRFAGNKLALSRFLQDKEFSHLEITTQKIPEHYPVVVRTELNRGGGIGIVICENEQEYNKYKGYAWSYWYNFKFELGVHILDGKIVKIFKKIRKEGLPEEKYPIKNTQRGYDFKLRSIEHYSGITNYVNELYKLIPIGFARLDIGYVDDEGYKLIEINSAPDLSQNQNTLNMYAEFLSTKI